MSRRRTAVTLALSSLFALGACASAGGLAQSGDDVQVTYADDADSNMELGEKAMASENYAEAARYFDFVRTKYPFVEAAKTAELRLADADFLRERYLEARDRYQNFVRLHPTHPKVDYAAWRAALTHYKDVPSDFFMLPPSSQKDQQEVRNALRAVGDFVRAYPDSKYLDEAKAVLSEVRERLAEHELYVADFYRSRERWPAVVGRLSTVVKKYPGTRYDERVYFGLYEAYRKLHDDTGARGALEGYLSQHPGGQAAERARSLLSALPAAPAAPTGS